jgi:hypothetical protein
MCNYIRFSARGYRPGGLAVGSCLSERRPGGRVLSRRLVGSVTNQIHPCVINRRRMNPMKQNNFVRAGTACHEGKTGGDGNQALI